MAVWSAGPYAQAQTYYDILERERPQQPRICAQALEPFYFVDHPEYRFPQLFADKRVLIITSHAATTRQQLSKHATLFTKPLFHPSTEFYVYKPAQQCGGNHDSHSWQHHLARMQQDLAEVQATFDFDVALVSCGGFGMILSRFIHSTLKKSVLYVGGALQLYFGIMGSRWRTHPVVSKLETAQWTSVLEEDKPRDPSRCEGGCYW